MAEPDYLVTMSQAISAFHQSQFRRATDYYWKSFRQATAVDKWADKRFIIFFSYTRMLSRKDIQASEQDMKHLSKVFLDPEEGVLYRLEAGYTMGDLFYRQDDWETAADYFRRAIAVADSATEVELNRSLSQIPGRRAPVSDRIALRRKNCADILLRLETNFCAVLPLPEMRIDGTCFTPYDTGLMRRLTLGGKECDSCHKTLVELSVTTIDCCTNCKAAYYCSRACQRAAWKAGHKEACRKPDERRGGDLMRLIGLEANSEWIGRMVTLVAAESNDMWKVRVYPGDEIIYVAATKLRHLRPAK